MVTICRDRFTVEHGESLAHLRVRVTVTQDEEGRCRVGGAAEQRGVRVVGGQEESRAPR